MKLEPTEEKTSFVAKPGESRMAGVSVRGWLALGLIGSVCFSFMFHLLAAVTVAVTSHDFSTLGNELLKAQVAMAERLALVALGYYFGKQELEHFAKRQP